MLANFAAGVFLIILRPFKNIVFIRAGGVNSTLTEICLFDTALHSPDSVQSIVGNKKKSLADNIQNYATAPQAVSDAQAALASSSRNW